MTTLTELCEGLNEPTVDLMEAINESIFAASKGGKVMPSIKGAKDFFVKHPALTIAAASLAVDAYSKYKQSERNTIKLFAKDAYEKKMMSDIVNTLTTQGKFKLAKTTYANGGRVWVLKRVGIGL